MRAHKHLQAHIHRRVSLSIFPLTCKMKGKYQIDTTTNYALPSDPASCWEGKQMGGVVLRHHHHHQVDRECDLAAAEKAAITAGILECLEVTLCDNKQRAKQRGTETGCGV